MDKTINKWDLSDDCNIACLCVNALYDFLVREDIFDDENKYSINDLEIARKYKDLLIISVDVLDREYTVGDYDMMVKSLTQNLEYKNKYEELEEIIPSELIDKNIILSLVRDEAMEIYTDIIRNDPEAYISNQFIELSYEQEKEINSLELNIFIIKKIINSILSGEVEFKDKNYRHLKVKRLESQIRRIEEEIEEIKKNPDGEFSEDAINNEIYERVDEAERYYDSFIRDFHLKILPLVDTNGLVEDLLTDEYLHVAQIIFNADFIEKETVKGKDFYIMDW